MEVWIYENMSANLEKNKTKKDEKESGVPL
jgi:hypothetical protein